MQGSHGMTDRDRPPDIIIQNPEWYLEQTPTHAIKVEPADVESTMAWKNGDFVLKDAPLQDVMNDLARWYDIEVVYADGAPKDVTISGWVSRNKNISTILKIMEKTEKAHFKIDGRRVTVMQ